MSKNKYGGVNDMDTGWTNACELNSRIYNLWFGILRRCYDSSQHSRDKGKMYEDCIVCKEWHYLSNFYRDIQKLDGYEDWAKKKSMAIDKDINAKTIYKQYSPETCSFVTNKENMKDMFKRHPNLTKNATESSKVPYILFKGDDFESFDSEKSACEFIGVHSGAVSKAYREKRKCKGFNIIRLERNRSVANYE